MDKNKPFTVETVVKKERKRQAPAPLTTSTLQQEANKRLGYRTRRTVSIAQQLYEGISPGKGGTVRLITYVHTNSKRTSPVARAEASKLLTETLGTEFASKSARHFKDQEDAQDVREAIRPTSVCRTLESLKKSLTSKQFKLHKLIWSRFVANGTAPAVFDIVRADIVQSGVVYRTTEPKMRFTRFTRVYDAGNGRSIELPDLTEGGSTKLSRQNNKQYFTLPPAWYIEANLIYALEKSGAGRPSTYAPTIDTTQRRYYAKPEGRSIVPTELGEIVNNLVGKSFFNIINVDFTAQLESGPDHVEEGKKNWVKVVGEYYKPFSKELEKADNETEKVQIKDEPAGSNRGVCGASMIIRVGRYSKSHACSRFPGCRNTKVIVKKIGVVCPKCGKGQIVGKKSEHGRKFFGCSGYPDCDFVSRDKLVEHDCPNDGYSLVEKKAEKGLVIQCSDGDYGEEHEEGENSR